MATNHFLRGLVLSSYYFFFHSMGHGSLSFMFRATSPQLDQFWPCRREREALDTTTTTIHDVLLLDRLCLLQDCLKLPISLNRLRQVNRLEITPDRRLLAAAGNPSIQFYEINPGINYPVLSYDLHTRNVTAIGFERDGNWMYSGSEDGLVKIWDLSAKAMVAALNIAVCTRKQNYGCRWS